MLITYDDGALDDVKRLNAEEVAGGLGMVDRCKLPGSWSFHRATDWYLSCMVSSLGQASAGDVCTI